MYAIFRTGGKQYKASPGDVIRVERVAGDPGSTVEFNHVFAVRTEKLTVGAPARGECQSHREKFSPMTAPPRCAC